MAGFSTQAFTIVFALLYRADFQSKQRGRKGVIGHILPYSESLPKILGLRLKNKKRQNLHNINHGISN
jgi:hypothetical protein